MIGARADDAHFDAVFRIPTCITIHDIDAITNIEVVEGAFSVDQKCMLIEFNIDFAPPDVFCAVGMIDNAFVVGAAASFCPRAYGERACAGYV